MAAVMKALVEHRGLERLHGWAHADESLAEFHQRQLHAFLVALGLERLDETRS